MYITNSDLIEITDRNFINTDFTNNNSPTLDLMDQQPWPTTALIADDINR